MIAAVVRATLFVKVKVEGQIPLSAQMTFIILRVYFKL